MLLAKGPLSFVRDCGSRALILVALLLVACQVRAGDSPSKAVEAAETDQSAVKLNRAAPPEEADAAALAASDAAIRYRLSFPAPHTHYVEVVLKVAAKAQAEDGVELFLPVWTPGSYLVREFSRHIEALTAAAADGSPLSVNKIAKNRWRVDSDNGGGTDSAAGTQAITVRYRVYARELSVRTNFIDADVALLNGAALFLTTENAQSLPSEVVIDMPKAWAHSATGLRRLSPAVTAGNAGTGGATEADSSLARSVDQAPEQSGDRSPDDSIDDQPHRYWAPDYDTLVDSPLVLGNPVIHHFEVMGVPHRVATFLPDPQWDADRVARDIETITAQAAQFWGKLPYDDYVYLVLVSGGGGGLEHYNSTVVLASPGRTQTHDDYVRWLGLISHELFHAWNVKALRPRALTRFDYEREVYTRLLWVAEGITSYYDDLLLRRAGLMSEDEYLQALSRQIKSLMRAPGRRVQSLALSSFDAWIKFYRSDENTRNSSISYYRKGAIVGFLLDMEIRRLSGGERSLDDVMRAAYERYGGGHGYHPTEFRALASEIAGRSLDDFFARAVDSTEELDFAPALAFLGLRFRPGKDPMRGDIVSDVGDSPMAGGEGRAEHGVMPAGWLGAKLSSGARRNVVEEVLRGTPAYAAGINVGDELIALDEYRIPRQGLGELLARYRPGEVVSALLARRGRLRRIDVELGSEPRHDEWTLEVMPSASSQQNLRRRAWLGETSP